MSDDPTKETLQKDCKKIAFDTLHQPGEGGQVIEWKGDDLIPLTPTTEEPQPARRPIATYVPRMGGKTRKRLELALLATITLAGVAVGLYYGAMTLIVIFEVLLSKEFIKAVLAVTAVALLFLMMAVKLSSRTPGTSYTPDERMEPGWMPPRHDRTTRQNNTTIINVTGDSASITTSNNNNS